MWMAVFQNVDKQNFTKDYKKLKTDYSRTTKFLNIQLGHNKAKKKSIHYHLHIY